MGRLRQTREKETGWAMPPALSEAQTLTICCSQCQALFNGPERDAEEDYRE